MPGDDRRDVARRLVGYLENADLEAVRANLSDRLSDWDPGPWITDRWQPQLDGFAGSPRTVADIRQVGATVARVVIVGHKGPAYVTVLFDAGVKVAGLSIDRTNGMDDSGSSSDAQMSNVTNSVPSTRC